MKITLKTILGAIYINKQKTWTNLIYKQQNDIFTLFVMNRWANWIFHVAFDARIGTVISLASIYDPEQHKYRSVLYRAYVSEFFIPYQDPTEEWYQQSFFDSGEFGFGVSTVPLEPLNDCPANAVFLDGWLAGRDGLPQKTPNAICIFERHPADIMWRHSETELPPGDVNLVFLFKAFRFSVLNNCLCGAD